MKVQVRILRRCSRRTPRPSAVLGLTVRFRQLGEITGAQQLPDPEDNQEVWFLPLKAANGALSATLLYCLYITQTC